MNLNEKDYGQDIKITKCKKITDCFVVNKTYSNLINNVISIKELNKYPSSKIISTWKTNGSIENEMIPLYWSDYNIKLIEHQYIVGPKKENRPKVIEALLFK